MILITSSYLVWVNTRRSYFRTLETVGFDAAQEYINNSKLPAHFKSAMKAEGFFFQKYKKKLHLGTLLDAGVKADFMGYQDGFFVNYDVTINLDYKRRQFSEYESLMKKKEIIYTIVLVDLKNEEIRFYPMIFPFCPSCGEPSYRILNIVNGDVVIAGLGFSGTQSIVQYCPLCHYKRNIKTYHLFQEPLESLRTDLGIAIRNEFLKECINEVQFFEKHSKDTINILAEHDYIEPRSSKKRISGDKVYWKHPLAPKFKILS